MPQQSRPLHDLEGNLLTVSNKVSTKLLPNARQAFSSLKRLENKPPNKISHDLFLSRLKLFPFSHAQPHPVGALAAMVLKCWCARSVGREYFRTHMALELLWLAICFDGVNSAALT
ncbi:hypothetical protein IG631_02558 [Alternaria alternata]|nr:hypothetical protein IG631_02558 [Alternaria alternata]